MWRSECQREQRRKNKSLGNELNIQPGDSLVEIKHCSTTGCFVVRKENPPLFADRCCLVEFFWKLIYLWREFKTPFGLVFVHRLLNFRHGMGKAVYTWCWNDNSKKKKDWFFIVRVISGVKKMGTKICSRLFSLTGLRSQVSPICGQTTRAWRTIDTEGGLPWLVCSCAIRMNKSNLQREREPRDLQCPARR